MKTTLSKIRKISLCDSSWKKLLKSLNKTKADDEPLSIITILDVLDLDDAIWCLRAVEGHDREIRLLSVNYAERVRHLMVDPNSVNALEVSKRYANGQATEEELSTARVAAWVAVEDARVAKSAAWTATVFGVSGVDWTATISAAWAAEAAWTARTAAWAAVRAAAWDAAWAAAWDAKAAAWAASRVAKAAAWAVAADASAATISIADASDAEAAEKKYQADELRRFCECVDNGIDPYPFKGESK